MATPSWTISGQYFETCSCDFVCPCILGQLATRPSKGSCTFAMAMQIERGSFGSVSLDGIPFVVLGYTPAEMGKGNWSVGLLIDERASAEQRDAITAIASGQAGGPMALQPDHDEFNTALIRAGYLVIIGTMLAYVTAYRDRCRDRLASLAHWPDDRPHTFA